MRTITISLDDSDKLHMNANDFADDLQELFYVLATSTRQVAQLIEDDKEKS